TKMELPEKDRAMVLMLTPGLLLLIVSAMAISTQPGLSGITNPGPHGLSQIIYAFASASGNNGSAFAGINADSVFYNLTTALAMLAGRFSTLIPALAIAGALASKKIIPEGVATFPTTGLLFVIMLACVVAIVGALTFFPVLTLGPYLEHLLVLAGKTF
ncbi:MAG: potassium-transporting ATPase subunit KdpA, partial [Deltaproteobacteria bacterium]|nr:potassium-transporting ATPase subunit KdpA [Deltaproteobacteria bacterium]